MVKHMDDSAINNCYHGPQISSKCGCAAAVASLLAIAWTQCVGEAVGRPPSPGCGRGEPMELCMVLASGH